MQCMDRLEFNNREWFPLMAAARFGASPTAKTLSAELNWLAGRWSPSEGAWLHPVPWPLAACLSHAQSKEDLIRLAESAQRGLLGDTKHWTVAEQRWKQIGLVDDDFLVSKNDELPISPEVSAKGFPVGAMGWVPNDSYSAGQIPASIELLRQMRDAEVSSWLASSILSLWEYPRGRRSIPSPSHIKELYEIASRRPRMRWRAYWLDSLVSSIPGSPITAEWVDFFDWLGRKGSMVSIDAPRQDLAEQLINHFCSNPEGRRGLLPIIAELARAGCRCVLAAHVLGLVKSWDKQAKDDAIGLSLCRPDVSDSEIAALAKETLQSDVLERASWRALRMASVSSSKQAAKYALALLGELHDLSEAESDAADHVRRNLSEFLTNRPSLLQDPEVWKRLNLPLGL